MGSKPEAVGDLAAFRITITPPDTAPAAVASSVRVLVRKPDGTETDDTVGVTPAGTNVFDYVASNRIDVDGPWRWRINSNAGIIDSHEIGLTISRSSFADPLP